MARLKYKPKDILKHYNLVIAKTVIQGHLISIVWFGSGAKEQINDPTVELASLSLRYRSQALLGQ